MGNIGDATEDDDNSMCTSVSDGSSNEDSTDFTVKTFQAANTSFNTDKIQFAAVVKIYPQFKEEPLQFLKLVQKFHNQIQEGPTIICACCGCLVFPQCAVTLLKLTNVLTKCAIFRHKILFVESAKHICKQCVSYLNQGTLPNYALFNGLNFPDVPPAVSSLTATEQLMVSPYICFMQIIELSKRCVNPQLGIRGTVFNIPIDVSSLFETALPRKFDEMCVILIELNRRLSHTSNHTFQRIRPYKILQALKHLEETPLYRKYDIKVDKDFFARYQDDPDTEINLTDSDAAVRLVCDGDGNISDVDCDITSEADSECSDDTLSSSHDSDSEEEDFENEILIQDNDYIQALKTQITVAPGQNEHPAPWHSDSHLEELCFPTIYGGHAYSLKRNITYQERVRSEILRYDLRARHPKKLLYSAKKCQEVQLQSKINIALRLNQNSELTAADASDPNHLTKLIEADHAYKILEEIRTSPAFWEARKKDLFAMIRQLGIPHLFVTHSAAEHMWTPLIKMLYFLKNGKDILSEDVGHLSAFDKKVLIQENPVTCAQYFHHKMTCVFSTLYLQKNGVFKKNPILDYYLRTEFKNCGSPHLHIFFWIKNLPNFDLSNPESIQEIKNFIKEIMTAKLGDLTSLQTHKDSHTCYQRQGEQKRKSCRFGFPKPIFDELTLLLPNSSASEDDKKNYIEIQKALKALEHQKRSSPVNLDQFLSENLDGLSKEDYCNAIQSSIKTPTFFLERNSLEIYTINYNPKLLTLLGSNMDIQFITDAATCMAFIINYILKTNSAVTRAIRQITESIANNPISASKLLYQIASVFSNFTTLGSQEAVYLILGIPVFEASRKCIFINTSKPEDRIRSLKSTNNLEQLSPESTNIYQHDNISLYALRKNIFEDICLADYLAVIKDGYKHNAKYDHITDIAQLGMAHLRLKPNVIRFCGFKLSKNASEFYREQCLLFVPWRNEYDDIISGNPEVMFHDPKIYAMIRTNSAKYGIQYENSSEIDLESLMFNVTETGDSDSKRECIQFQDQFQQTKPSISKSIDATNAQNYSIPRVEILKSDDSIIQSLNTEQKKFVLQVLHNFKLNLVPFHYFLSGNAGTGKSYTVLSITQLVQSYFNSTSDLSSDSNKVLVMAPTGEAAFIVNGTTLHHALALPLSNHYGPLTELSAGVANRIRSTLFDTKLVIIDGVSMLGNQRLSHINMRLQQIFENNELFGNKSVILVGDLHQIRPNEDSHVFLPDINEITNLNAVILWRKFKCYELQTTMRQRDEISFTRALNNFAEGTLQEMDVELLNSRNFETNLDQIPDDCIHLFHSNTAVDYINEMILSQKIGRSMHCKAIDVTLSKVSFAEQKSIHDKAKKVSTSDSLKLNSSLFLKLWGRYMITHNIDFRDGLIHGTIGTLVYIDDWNHPNTVFMVFDDAQVGKMARINLEERFGPKVLANWTPIKRLELIVSADDDTKTKQVLQSQFPIAPAEAVKIHKSEGSTFGNTCIHLNDQTSSNTELMYVAMSRVKSINNLYLIGSVHENLSKKNMVLNTELTRLRGPAKLNLPLYGNIANDRVTVYYHNVQTLTDQKVHNIIFDPIYNFADIIILSEANVHKQNLPVFPNRQSIPVGENTRSQPGPEQPGKLTCLCLSNEILPVLFRLYRVIKQKILSLFLLKFKHIYIISGYISPQFPLYSITRYVKEIKKRIPLSASLILLGDFNFNIQEPAEKQFLDNLFADFNLQCALDPAVFTTIQNKHLDIIYSNIPNVLTQLYTTYYSDHFPVIIQVLDLIK